MRVIDQRIDAWLKVLDKAPLECDGMTRCISTLMSHAGYTHTVHDGQLEVLGKGKIDRHFWISTQTGEIIDLRARMWLGKHELVPHGKFSPSADQIYTSHAQIDPQRFLLSPTLFYILCFKDLELLLKLGS
ncbi:hypothetical protein KXJ72_17505 (plasmid) [Comamonas aquatica]|nr:hypothetical protein KXJ72_17505 [Comamonas aquatica]